jgi:hypothetical protein
VERLIGVLEALLAEAEPDEFTKLPDRQAR